MVLPTERDAAREAGTKYDAAKQRPTAVYSAGQLQEIYGLYEAEQLRGAEPRYAADVEVGERCRRWPRDR